MRHLIHWFVPAIAAALFVALAPTAARAADKKGSVTGTVVDGSGKGLAGLTVKVIRPRPSGEVIGVGGGASTVNRTTTMGTATTDSDGKFTVADIPSGDYIVYAGKQGVGKGHAPVTVAAGAAATVTITIGSTSTGK